MHLTLDYLRERKRGATASLVSKLECRSGLEIRTFRDVSLKPLGQIPAPYPETSGHLIVDDNEFLAEVMPKKPTGGERIAGVSLYGGWLRRVWGHFLMGGTARLWPIAKGDLLKDVDTVIFFSNDLKEPLGGNYLELMQLLGVADKIRIIDHAVCVDRLIVPDISFEHDVFSSVECRDTFDYIRMNALKCRSRKTRRNAPKKIFLTRLRLKNALTNEVNLDKIDKLFSDNGFDVISPERMSLTEMINLFEEATELATLSGSIAHNLIFDAPSSDRRHIIIERHPRPNTFQINIDLMMGYRTVYVDGFYLPNFSCSSNSVMLYAMTPQLMDFADRANWDMRSFDGYNSTKTKRKELKQFLSRYRRYFGNSETIAEWEIEDAPVIAEAVIDTCRHYNRWLIDHMPLLWFDYLTSGFLYRAVKSMLRGR